MTARTRSARRSNPQRMSNTSLAIQIRAPCARSIACKTWQPDTPPPLLPSTTPVHVRIESCLTIRLRPSSSRIQRSNRRACSAHAPPLQLQKLFDVSSSSRFFHTKIRPAQTVLATKRFTTCPLRDCSETSLSHFVPPSLSACHVATLHCDANLYKWVRLALTIFSR